MQKWIGGGGKGLSDGRQCAARVILITHDHYALTCLTTDMDSCPESFPQGYIFGMLSTAVAQGDILE